MQKSFHEFFLNTGYLNDIDYDNHNYIQGCDKNTNIANINF